MVYPQMLVTQLTANDEQCMGICCHTLPHGQDVSCIDSNEEYALKMMGHYKE